MIKVLHVMGNSDTGWSRGILTSFQTLHQYLGAEFNAKFINSPNDISSPADFDPDIVVFHGASNWRTLRSFARFARYKRIIVEHHYSYSFIEACVPSRRRFRTMLRLNYLLADSVVFVSQGQYDWAISSNLTNKNKTKCIHSSSVTDQLVQLEYPDHSSDLVVFGAYGRLEEQKGFVGLIEQFKTLDNPYLRLLIGGTGSLQKKLDDAACGDPRISFYGLITKLDDFLGQCHAIIIPSRWEPWGMVALEARSAGRPIICTAVDGLTEQTTGCGLLVTDHCDIASTIQQYINIPNHEKDEWSRSARESTLNEWDQHVSQWRTLLTDLYSQR